MRGCLSCFNEKNKAVGGIPYRFLFVGYNARFRLHVNLF